MKYVFVLNAIAILVFISHKLSAQPEKFDKRLETSLYIDVHHLKGRKIMAKDVAEGHKKLLAVQHKYGVTFLKYWFDEKNGDLYCLVSCNDPEEIKKAHKEADGFVPEDFYKVTSGEEAILKGKNNLYLDVHQLGEGKVTASDVAGAHQKDLAIQKKYGVNLINYWVDEKKGTVMCLAQAPDSTALINTHKDAHGLVPDRVSKVVQGQ